MAQGRLILSYHTLSGLLSYLDREAWEEFVDYPTVTMCYGAAPDDIVLDVTFVHAISFGHLLSVLPVADGTEIASTRPLGGEKVEVVISHPEIPSVGDGEELPLVLPMYKLMKDSIEFVSWKWNEA